MHGTRSQPSERSYPRTPSAMHVFPIGRARAAVGLAERLGIAVTSYPARMAVGVRIPRSSPRGFTTCGWPRSSRLSRTVTHPSGQDGVRPAPTLVYDCMISDATLSTLLRSIEVPTLVLDSEGSTDDLAGWAATAAAQLPRGSHPSLPAEWHVVPDQYSPPCWSSSSTGSRFDRGKAA